MSCRVVIHPDMASSCRKLQGKSPARYAQIKKKVRFLVENPESGKPLHPPLNGIWRVHLGHFILLYSFDPRLNEIVPLKLVHHDDAYH